MLRPSKITVLLVLVSMGALGCFNKTAPRSNGDAALSWKDPALIEALHALKVEHWTWPGPIGLREGEAIHVVDGWRWLGTATDEATLADLLEAGRPAFDLDIYKILVKAVKRLAVVNL